MKKTFLYALAAMACFSVLSCSEKPGDDNKGDDNQDPVETPTEINIAIDGDFSDWDAVTETSEDGTVYFCAEGAEGYKNIRNLKATSDASYIYMCVEVAVSKIKMDAGGHHGDSWNGAGFKWPYNPIWIYIDSDNNPATGITAHMIGADLDSAAPVFSDFGGDNFVQIYNWIATETGLWDMAWSQVNVKLAEVEDGDSIDNGSKWPTTSEYPDGYGWDHNKDNTVITFDNFKTKLNGQWAICEFAIDRSLLVDNKANVGVQTSEIAFGVANQSGGADGSTGWSGIIPSDRKPAVLKLKD